MSTLTVRITPAAADAIRRLPPDVKRAVKAAVRSLVVEPGLGVPLQRELSDLWRYRVRRYRIVYAVDRRRRRLTILAVGHRRSIYDDLVRRVRR